LLIGPGDPYTWAVPRFKVTAFYSTEDLWLRRVSCNGDDGSGPREEYADEDNIIFVLRGRFVLRDRRARVVVSPCRALALRAGDPYTIEHPHGEGDVCLSIGGRHLLPPAGDHDRTCAVSTAGYMRVLALIERLAVRERVDRFAVEETLHVALAPQDDRGVVSARDRAIAETIAQAVDLRFDEHLMLDELAGIAGISVFHACRAFRRARNTSIHRYRQTVRLRHALALLRDTSWPLARVAVDAGFANQGHLGNVFRRRLGVTPARARRMPAARWVNAPGNNL
jgi:AraC family transcriptional regulator